MLIFDPKGIKVNRAFSASCFGIPQTLERCPRLRDRRCAFGAKHTRRSPQPANLTVANASSPVSTQSAYP